MAERIAERERLAAKISTLTDSEVTELLDYVKIMESMRRQVSSPALFEDEVIEILAGSPEDHRARALLEWERARRRGERVPFAPFPQGYSA